MLHQLWVYQRKIYVHKLHKKKYENIYETKEDRYLITNLRMTCSTTLRTTVRCTILYFQLLYCILYIYYYSVYVATTSTSFYKQQIFSYSRPTTTSWGTVGVERILLVHRRAIESITCPRHGTTSFYYYCNSYQQIFSTVAKQNQITP